MKVLIAAALIATFVPVSAAVSAGRPEPAPRERRYCTDIEQRSGSRMAFRRVCRTQAQWREALGPDWRQHLAGARNIEEDADALMMRSQQTAPPAMAPN